VLALLDAIGLDPADGKSVAAFARTSGVALQNLRYYHESRILPSGTDLDAICQTAGVTPAELAIRIGRIDHALTAALQRHAAEIAAILARDAAGPAPAPRPQPVFATGLGTLYNDDCLKMLRSLKSDSVDLVFADPPFNLNKLYPSGIDDNLKEEQYVAWCEEWLAQCVRVLAPGGSLFLWNIPRWNAVFSAFLSGRLTFRHWISVDIKYSLPVPGRLYPSHYSLLYYCKGPKPRRFHPDRLPMQVCPECNADLKDYGGYKNKMNPEGVSLTDVWYDVPPVRHSKYKKRNGANELPLKLLDRVLEIASEPGDLVLDPFGGAGTTYAVAEMKHRRWIGSEIGPVDGIIARLSDLEDERSYLADIRRGYNRLFTPETAARRKRQGRWTDETFAPPRPTPEPDPGRYEIAPGQGVLELRERARRRYGPMPVQDRGPGGE
jgi:site-specific DNA-methyltransferase (adenine-specific)